MTNHEDLMLIKELKVLILDQVQALYGPHHPTSSFAVIISRFGSSPLSDMNYTAQAIVYKQPNSFAEWEFLMEGEIGSTPVLAVESLYQKTQEKANGVTRWMGERMVWNGVNVKRVES